MGRLPAYIYIHLLGVKVFTFLLLCSFLILFSNFGFLTYSKNNQTSVQLYEA